MLPRALFGISVMFGFVVWGLVARQYFWPALRGRSTSDAVRPILFLHAFRFMGLLFLIPGVVSPELPASFARPVAYGDLATAVLALLALATLGGKLSAPSIWLFNLVGAMDLLNAYYQGNRIALVPGHWARPMSFPPLLCRFCWRRTFSCSGSC